MTAVAADKGAVARAEIRPPLFTQTLALPGGALLARGSPSRDLQRCILPAAHLGTPSDMAGGLFEDALVQGWPSLHSTLVCHSARPLSSRTASPWPAGLMDLLQPFSPSVRGFRPFFNAQGGHSWLHVLIKNNFSIYTV